LPARRALYVFTAKGAISFLIWGIVPGTDRAVNAALKARFKWGSVDQTRIDVNSRFQRCVIFLYLTIPGALPHVEADIAPSALNSSLALPQVCHGESVSPADESVLRADLWRTRAGRCAFGAKHTRALAAKPILLR
jgi:hypothetical protein